MDAGAFQNQQVRRKSSIIRAKSSFSNFTNTRDNPLNLDAEYEETLKAASSDMTLKGLSMTVQADVKKAETMKHTIQPCKIEHNTSENKSRMKRKRLESVQKPISL